MDYNEVWRLLQALKDKDKFESLSLEEKLEALRLHSIQSVHNREDDEV